MAIFFYRIRRYINITKKKKEKSCLFVSPVNSRNEIFILDKFAYKTFDISCPSVYFVNDEKYGCN